MAQRSFVVGSSLNLPVSRVVAWSDLVTADTRLDNADSAEDIAEVEIALEQVELMNLVDKVQGTALLMVAG